MVPILEVTSDSTSTTRFIAESAAINEFIIATFAPAEKDKATKDEPSALTTLFMENTVSLWYQVVYYKVDAKKDELVASFNEFAAQLENDFLGGSDIGVADYNIWVSTPISSGICSLVNIIQLYFKPWLEMMRLTHPQCFNGTLLDYVNRLAVFPEIEKVTCPLATIGAFFASRSFDEGL